MAAKSKHYINSSEFANELKLSQESGIVTDKMYKLFQLLARKCSGSFIYNSNDDRNDCINNAVLVMAKSFMKFDFNKKETPTSAFSYFTSVAYNGLRQGWNELNSKNDVTYRIDQIFTEHL